MKKLLSIGLLFTLAACGGGCGGGGGADGASAAAVSAPAAQTSPDPSGPPAQAAKSVVDYEPSFMSLVAGSYGVFCGRTDRPRIPAVVKVSVDGFLTPWLGKALDLKPLALNFSRAARSNPTEGFTGGVGTIGGTGSLFLGINSDGTVKGGYLDSGAPSDDQLGSDALPDVLGVKPPFAGVLNCDGSAEATGLATKSAYTAFAKYLDAPKTTFLCLPSNPASPTSGELRLEPYEVSNGELRYLGKTISLLSGIQKETVGAIGRGTAMNVGGATVYKKNVAYSLDKLDGTSVAFTLNEFGETVSLTYQVGTAPPLVCIRQS